MKRRVIAIAVVLAVVGVACWTNWESVAFKRVLIHHHQATELARVWRLGGVRHGPRWTLYHEPSGSAGVVFYEEYENGKSLAGSITTIWGPDGRISSQNVIGDNRSRTSPPWWPHPPLIDLREFEE